MKVDGGLSDLFRKNVPEAHWQRVETWSTGQGVPDLNYCIDGCEGWVENKLSSALAVNLDPAQVGWILRRCRSGGRVTIAVRQKRPAGPRRGEATQALYLFDGAAAALLKTEGLRAKPLLVCNGPPGRWDWTAVRELLRR